MIGDKKTKGLTVIGEELSEKYWFDRVQRLKPSPEEMLERARLERIEKEARFWDTLKEFLTDQIGIGYAVEHISAEGTCQDKIQAHILTLLETGKGACYIGRMGSGKTHTLLEFAIQLCYREWDNYVRSHDYPNPLEFIQKTCHFAYATSLCEAFRLGEKISYAKYNLVDDLGAEVAQPFVQSKWDDYFEEINRRGLRLVISTNLEKKDLMRIERYKRIYSRLLAKCKFYVLPAIDRRDPKNQKSKSGDVSFAWHDTWRNLDFKDKEGETGADLL